MRELSDRRNRVLHFAWWVDREAEALTASGYRRGERIATDETTLADLKVLAEEARAWILPSFSLMMNVQQLLWPEQFADKTGEQATD
jgi:hypothetical protein